MRMGASVNEPETAIDQCRQQSASQPLFSLLCQSRQHEGVPPSNPGGREGAAGLRERQTHPALKFYADELMDVNVTRIGRVH